MHAHVTQAAHRAFTIAALSAAGAARHDADDVADAMLWCDSRGGFEEGITRLPALTQRLERGLIFSPAEMLWSPSRGSVQTLDAGDAFGQVAGRAAMFRAVEIARAQGIGLVAVRRSNHFGSAGYYCAQAAEAGILGFACTNAIPKVAPHGGSRPVLGTNPLAFGCPTRRGPPVLVDFSTSTMSGATLRRLVAEGAHLPPDTALDAEGRPTDDPRTAEEGCLLPAAGHKGFGLALIVEILSGLLSGGAVGREVNSMFHTWDRPAGAAHCFGAIAPDSFDLDGTFLVRLEGLLEQIRGCAPRDPATPVRYPGVSSAGTAERATREGIALGDRTITALHELADRVGVPRLSCA